MKKIQYNVMGRLVMVRCGMVACDGNGSNNNDKHTTTVTTKIISC